MLTLYPGEAQGQLVGGCLSVFVSTLGTEWEVDTRDKILFFEDIDERPHRIDRYLTQLLLANKLQAARAILFGTFTRCEYTERRDHAGPRVRTLDIIRDRVLPLQKPCLYGLQFGHVRDKLTLPQRRIRLSRRNTSAGDCGARCQLNGCRSNLNREPLSRYTQIESLEDPYVIEYSA